MQKKITFLAFLLFSFLFGFSQNQTNYWTDLEPGSYELTGSFRGIPTDYRALQLNTSSLRRLLGEVPLEQFGVSQQKGKVFLLPYPDGSFQRFNLVESPIMEAGLANKFSEIKTYAGKGIDDPYTTIRISMAPNGYHAILHTVEGTIYIDPYPAVNEEVYFSYYKKDYRAAKTFVEMALPQDPGNMGGGPILPLGSGQTMRSYRIAVATTGEYAAFHGGNTGSVMSAIVTTMNRVNSIYEREVAVRMILVNNNDRIVYLDSNTDPFTNNDASALISENQVAIDSEIGTLNYDIGHVFSTGGGGLASPGVVCLANFKANGVTGTNSPIGDPFDVDYVAHEIGHQFSASHTFNSRQGDCQGNRSNNSAYEPGSGSTIMAYAGLCSFDNLQGNSNDYFHHRSYNQILNYITNRNGNTCGTAIPTGNTPPSVGIIIGNTTIPIMTPFELEGGAADIDGDSVTFCWEQYDLGPSGSPNNPAGDAPIFRSFPPTPDPIRIFPQLEDIINNTSRLGEVLPTYGRNLTFRLTARDNNSNGGGVEFASTQFTVTNQAGPFELIFPNMQTTVWIRAANVKVPIRWNPANTQLAPVNCDSVSILLSVDGGYTYPFTLARSVANTGMASVGFPSINTDSARVKIKARGNVFFTISEEDFFIKLDNVSLEPEAAGLHVDIGPNPVSEVLHIQLKSEQTAPIKFELMDINGREVRSFESQMVAGRLHSNSLNVSDLPGGIYIYRLRFGDRFFQNKVLIQ